MESSTYHRVWKLYRSYNTGTSSYFAHSTEQTQLSQTQKHAWHQGTVVWNNLPSKLIMMPPIATYFGMIFFLFFNVYDVLFLEYVSAIVYNNMLVLLCIICLCVCVYAFVWKSGCADHCEVKHYQSILHPALMNL